jgi:hypothetical protein
MRITQACAKPMKFHGWKYPVQNQASRPQRFASLKRHVVATTAHANAAIEQLRWRGKITKDPDT